MKIKLITSLLFLALISCHEIKQEDNIPTSKLEALTTLGDLEEDSLKKQKETAVTSTKPEAEPMANTTNREKPLLIARGNEPGWYAEFFKDRATIVLDYGKDTVLVKHDFTTINSTKNFTAQISESSNPKGKKTAAKLSIHLTSKTCVEPSGDKKDKGIVINYKGIDYKGCAGIN